MSCTVIALPITIAGLVMGLAMQGALVGANIAIGAKNSKLDSNNLNNNIDQNKNLAKYIKELQQELLMNESENKDLCEYTYKTVYTDANLLIKTLTEHGAENLTDNEGVITCEVEDYKLTFSKDKTDGIYEMKIVCPQNISAEDKINDLNSEYTSNVQEDTYLHIVDKLKENNMELESEEVLEDNTIVLTVNLE